MHTDNEPLWRALQDLVLRGERVRVTWEWKNWEGRTVSTERTGYIRACNPTWNSVRMASRENVSSGTQYHNAQNIVSIKGTRGKRVAGKLVYPTYYEACPYAVSADGELDMESTLKKMLAFG
jgi:hypothetical protein